MHIVRSVRSEKNGRSPEIIRLSPTAGGDPLQNGFAANGIAAQGFGIVRADIARRNAVDIDMLRRPFIGQGFDEAGKGALARRVARDIDAALKTQQTTGEDDLSTAPGKHVPTEFTSQDKGCVKVYGQDFVPVFVGVLGSGLA